MDQEKDVAPLATLRAQLEKLTRWQPTGGYRTQMYVPDERHGPLGEYLNRDEVLGLLDALLRPSRPPEENFPQEQFLSTGHVGGGAGAQSDDTVAASRPPEEPNYSKLGCEDALMCVCMESVEIANYQGLPELKFDMGKMRRGFRAVFNVERGSCLICGHDRPYAVRQNGVGVCFDCRNTVAASREAQEQQTMKQETAWLIGRVGPQWWTGRDNEWTTFVDGSVADPARCAIRFARREDAQRAIRWLIPKEQREFCQAEEHIWG